MEEKKKRWRPSLTAYREMEETVHRQCVELDAWRDKYRILAKQEGVDGVSLVLKGDYDAVCSERDELLSKLSTLEQSNKSMEDELNRKVGRESANLKYWKEKAIERETEVMRLRDRGFWARVFNR